MADLGAYTEDVQFNWTKASDLASELRSTANVLEYQVGERDRIKATPLEHWRGVYGEQFEGRVGTCTADAAKFVTSMRDAATRLDEMARLAREEQERREAAREWVANNDDGGFWDGLGDLVFGEDDQPPPPPPVDPPTIGIEAPAHDARASV
jgi:hypothetical protein